jgi:hypothetical protein
MVEWVQLVIGLSLTLLAGIAVKPFLDWLRRRIVVPAISEDRGRHTVGATTGTPDRERNLGRNLRAHRPIRGRPRRKLGSGGRLARVQVGGEMGSMGSHGIRARRPGPQQERPPFTMGCCPPRLGGSRLCDIRRGNGGKPFVGSGRSVNRRMRRGCGVLLQPCRRDAIGLAKTDLDRHRKDRPNRLTPTITLDAPESWAEGCALWTRRQDDVREPSASSAGSSLDVYPARPKRAPQLEHALTRLRFRAQLRSCGYGGPVAVNRQYLSCRTEPLEGDGIERDKLLSVIGGHTRSLTTSMPPRYLHQDRRLTRPRVFHACR